MRGDEPGPQALGHDSRHRTSFSLEQPFLDELERIAAARGVALAALVAEIDAGRGDGTNLSSALRLFVLAELKTTRAPE